ncbi:MAG: DUF1573 domain-containing protein [Bacteroidales bacterium]|jgi:hypothetical protein|nr:DUF1573 domain-containing protein [Bacteroidales bacterium]
MKKLFLVVALCCAGLVQGWSQNPEPAKAENPNAPEITFDELIHDFGTLVLNSKAETEFIFTNTGKEPLTITQCSASCGCTAPSWSKEPVKPGEKGSIKVVYKNTNYAAPFSKIVTVTSNAKTSKVILTIKGTVVQGQKAE